MKCWGRWGTWRALNGWERGKKKSCRWCNHVMQSCCALLRQEGSPWRSPGGTASSRWESDGFLILSFLAREERVSQCSHGEDKSKGPKHFRLCTCPSVSGTDTAQNEHSWSLSRACNSLLNTQDDNTAQCRGTTSSLWSDSLRPYYNEKKRNVFLAGAVPRWA